MLHPSFEPWKGLLRRGPYGVFVAKVTIWKELFVAKVKATKSDNRRECPSSKFSGMLRSLIGSTRPVRDMCDQSRWMGLRA